MSKREPDQGTLIATASCRSAGHAGLPGRIVIREFPA
jgi:hypothetical protein